MDLVPDLEMAPIFDLEVRTTASGHKKLRFGTTVYNVGDGPIEVRSRNPSGGVMQRVVQAIKRSDGTWHRILKPDAEVFYSGDGHDHYHVARFNRVTLTPLPGTPTSAERRVRKIGFCLVDTHMMPSPPPNTPAVRAYAGCGTKASASVTMGISVGWGDVYSADTRFQSIDVTGLPAGAYRICATANPRGIWTEKSGNFSNNSSWIDIELDVANNTAEPIGEPQNSRC